MFSEAKKKLFSLLWCQGSWNCEIHKIQCKIQFLRVVCIWIFGIAKRVCQLLMNLKSTSIKFINKLMGRPQKKCTSRSSMMFLQQLLLIFLRWFWLQTFNVFSIFNPDMFFVVFTNLSTVFSRDFQIFLRKCDWKNCWDFRVSNYYFSGNILKHYTFKSIILTFKIVKILKWHEN